MIVFFDIDIYDEGVVEMNGIGLYPDREEHDYWRTNHTGWNRKKVEQIVDCLYAHLSGMESSDYKDIYIDIRYDTSEGRIVVPLVVDEMEDDK